MEKRNSYGTMSFGGNEYMKNNTGYMNYLFIVLGIAAVAGAGYFGYRWYIVSREQSAQVMFAECLREYEKGVRERQTWADIQALWAAGYARHTQSSLAPYFKAFEANSALKQDKKAEAVALLDAALSLVAASSPLYTVYATKRALINIDLGNEAGLQELEKLAYDKNNIQRDVALYYLGLYHWSKNNIEDAKEAWETLTALPDSPAQATLWTALAEQKLQQIA